MKYFIVKCSIKSKDLTEENYGIMVLHENGNRRYICNITDCAEEIESLVDKMNTYHIEPCQANEIIEDFKFNRK